MASWGRSGLSRRGGGESMEDLLKMQESFFEKKEMPAGRLLPIAEDKKDVVSLEGPSIDETPNTSGIKKENLVKAPDDPEERLNAYESKRAPEKILGRVLNEIYENMYASPESYKPPTIKYSSGFPTASNIEISSSMSTQISKTERKRSTRRKKSRFAMEMERKRRKATNQGRKDLAQKPLGQLLGEDQKNQTNVAKGDAKGLPRETKPTNKIIGSSMPTQSLPPTTKRETFNFKADGDVNWETVIGMTENERASARKEIESLLGSDVVRELQASTWAKAHLPNSSQTVHSLSQTSSKFIASSSTDNVDFIVEKKSKAVKKEEKKVSNSVTNLKNETSVPRWAKNFRVGVQGKRLKFSLKEGDEEPPGYSLRDLILLTRSAAVQQRGAILQIITKVLSRARCGEYEGDSARVINRFMDLGLIAVLRVAIDENSHMSNLLQAMRALLALMIEPGIDHVRYNAEVLWSSSFSYPMAPKLSSNSVNPNDTDDSKISKTSKDLLKAREDLITTLVTDMSFLRRLSFILLKFAPPDALNYDTKDAKEEDNKNSEISLSVLSQLAEHSLQLLLRVALHSVKMKEEIVATPNLLATIFQFTTPQNSLRPSRISEFSLQILVELAKGGNKMASTVARGCGACKGIIVSYIHRNNAAKSQSANAATAVWNLWKVCVYSNVNFGSIVSYREPMTKYFSQILQPAAVSLWTKSKQESRHIRAAYNAFTSMATKIRSRKGGSMKWSHLAAYLQLASRCIPYILVIKNVKSMKSSKHEVIDQNSNIESDSKALRSKEQWWGSAIAGAGMLHFLAECGEARAEKLSASSLKNQDRKSIEHELKLIQSQLRDLLKAIQRSPVLEWATISLKRACTPSPPRPILKFLPTDPSFCRPLHAAPEKEIACDLILSISRQLRALINRARVLRVRSFSTLFGVETTNTPPQVIVNWVSNIIDILILPRKELKKNKLEHTTSRDDGWEELPPAVEQLGRIGALLSYELVDLVKSLRLNEDKKESEGKQKDLIRPLTIKSVRALLVQGLIGRSRKLMITSMAVHSDGFLHGLLPPKEYVKWSGRILSTIMSLLELKDAKIITFGQLDQAVPGWVHNVIPGYGWLLTLLRRGSKIVSKWNPEPAIQYASDMLVLLLALLRSSELGKGTPRLHQSVFRAALEIFRLSSDVWSDISVLRPLRKVINMSTGRGANSLRMAGFLHPHWGPFYPFYSELCEVLAFDGANESSLEIALQLMLSLRYAQDYRKSFWRNESRMLLRVTTPPPFEAIEYLGSREQSSEVLNLYKRALCDVNVPLGRKALGDKGPVQSCLYQIAVHHLAQKTLIERRYYPLLEQIILEAPKDTIIDIISYFEGTSEKPSPCKSQNSSGSYEWCVKTWKARLKYSSNGKVLIPRRSPGGKAVVGMLNRISKSDSNVRKVHEVLTTLFQISS